MESTQSIDNQLSTDNERNTQIKSTFDLLKRGEQEIKLSDNYKDIVLVLGNTGAGKTTFTQWIAGDNDKLIAKEVAEGTGEFLIEDNNRIGNSTIKSKTIFPERVIDSKTNTVYYDCPGFSDTRSTSNDIATTYFIKKVLDHAESIKLIFIINYPSVRKGVDRQDFMKLIRHTTDLVKNIVKFQNSIAIVVTKVDNQYVKQGKSFTLIEDSKVIGAISDFLQEVKQDLRERVKLSDISVKEQKFYDNAMRFIDVLLVKEGSYYTKIGIFRRPDEPGPLSNITLLQEGKEHIKRILYDSLNFTQKDDEDFGYTISEKSKNDINDLVEEINKNVWFNISNIAEKMQAYYYDLVQQVCDKIKSFVTSGTVLIDVDQSEAQIFSSKFSNGYNIMSNLVKELTNLTNPEELAAKINSSITSLDICLFRDNILDVAYQGRYVNFLQIVSNKELSTRPWAELFKGILPYFFELRENIENNVNDTAQKINNCLNDTTKAIYKHYYKKMKLLEIQKLSAELEKDHDVMFNLAREIENAVITNELLKTIHDSANSLGIGITKNNIPIIINQEKYFNFLKVISNKELITGTLTWINPFKDAVKYLDKSGKWYKFLDDLFIKFSEYEIQKDRSKYNVADLADWGNSGKPQGIKINQNNFEQFLNKIAGTDNIKNITLTGLQLQELNQVLNLTLKHRMNISCIAPYLCIRGNYIIVKEALEISIKILLSHWGGTIANITNFVDVDIDDSCKDATVFTSGRLKFTNVFVLNTLFIDEDVTLEVSNPLSVISPKWEIIGTRKIVLDGVKGETHYESASQQKNERFTIYTIHRSKAKDGAYPGASGTDGKPGRAGGNGGTFFGIGKQFIDGENLTITVNGGSGGLGQEGGNGWNGKDGYSPAVPSTSDISCRNDLCDGNKQINGFDCVKIHYSSRGGQFGGYGVQTYTEPLELYCECKIFGKSGEKGGDGGNGGRGGKGGNPGNIVLFELNNYSEISKYNNTGREGKNGIGGIGGSGGYNGNDIVIYYTNSWAAEGWHLKERIYNKKSPSGRNGTDGANTKNMEDPKPADIVLESAKIINQYKSYLRENLNDRFKKSSLIEFLNKMDSNQNVRNVYNILALVDELQSLEEQFHKLNKDLLPFYQSLLSRISEYAQNPKEVGDPNQYKKVLGYLYTATLGRIYNLQDDLESYLIINITSYLNSIQEDIDKLKDLKNAKNKLNIISKHKQEYKNRIDVKIKEAQDLISKEVMPEIDNIGTEIDQKITSLTDEVIVLQKQNKAEQDELRKKEQELASMLPLTGFFNAFKLLGLTASLFVPFGTAVSSVVGMVSGIAESLTLDNQNSQQQVTQLPQGIAVIEDQIKAMKDREVARLSKSLLEISQAASQYPAQLSDVSAKAIDIKNRLHKAHNFNEIKVLKIEAQQALSRKEAELKLQKVSVNEKTANAIVVIGKLKSFFAFGSGVADIYIQNKNNQARLDAVTKAVEKKKDEFQQLKQYEEKIYDLITPTLQNMQDDLKDIASKLGNKSSVALDVTKWQIQSTIRDIKVQMQQLTDGFKVKDNLAHCIEKLEAAMNLLISMYDHIQNYQKDQTFVNYITDISSITADDIDIAVNPELGNELRNAVHDLEITVRSSIVFQRYQTAIDAFKQFVFPFAHIYLKRLVLPSHLELGSNKNNTALENLVYEAITQIEQIQSNLAQYKVSLTKHKSPIGIGEFNSHYDSTQPFFIWKNEQHKNMISRLLSGQELVVDADIMNSSPDKDAIKFNNIELNFKSKNESAQSEINHILKGFNISMTHLGNSYYRYKNKIYLMTTNSQDIWYYFERKNNGEPVHQSIVYDELKNGNFMLSPYALWRIKLINIKNKNNFSFKDLESYKSKIDLELGGNGYYVNKEGINEDLMVERYYKATDAYNHLDLNVNNEELNIVSVLQASNSTRNACEVNQELENTEFQTMVDQKHHIILSQANAEHENSNTVPSGWFSWLKLPSFNILPGAEAVVIKHENLANQKEYVISSLDSITMPFINAMKLLKDVVSLKTLKPSDNITSSNSSEKISNNYTDYVIREGSTSNSLNNLAISFDSNKNNNMQATTTVDINGNLTFGQLVIHKVFGSNKSLSVIHYVSPEQEQNIRTNKLASEILPIVNGNSLDNHSVNGFVKNYDCVPRWYHDMYKDKFKDMMSKRHQRNEKKNMCENSSEEIFTDSVWMKF